MSHDNWLRPAAAHFFDALADVFAALRKLWTSTPVFRSAEEKRRSAVETDLLRIQNSSVAIGTSHAVSDSEYVELWIKILYSVAKTDVYSIILWKLLHWYYLEAYVANNAKQESN